MLLECPITVEISLAQDRNTESVISYKTGIN